MLFIILLYTKAEHLNPYCYTWGEADGKRGSYEIVTSLFHYLNEKLDSSRVTTVLCYRDNCTGQNKNKVIFSTLKYSVWNVLMNIQTIQINYLLPGHTYMPVDSMHAIIEREIKKLIVWGPSQWPSFMESARKRPHAYRVNVIGHQDFFNFNDFAESVFTPATLKNKNLHFKKIGICTFQKSNLKIFIFDADKLT